MRFAPFALAACLLATPVWACDPAAAPETFQTGDAGWGDADAQFRVENNAAILAPEVGTQTARWNAGKSMTDADVCVTIEMPDSTAEASRGYAGVLFWGVDKDNFYQAVISRNGMVTVARKVGGRILSAPLVHWTPSSAIKTGADATNTLRITTEGENVAVRINDTEVARFRGQAPEAASHIGLIASSAPGAVDTWRFTDFKLASPPAAAADATAATTTPPAPEDQTTGAVPVVAETGCGPGRVLFEDKFTDHDPMWGAKDGEVKLSGGEAEFDPNPGTSTLRWNRAFVFSDMDACLTVRPANNTANPTASYAGLLFWVQDSRNYYQAVVAPNGYFTVARIVDGKVVAKRPVAWTKVPAVKPGSKERNTLRVTIKGSDVELAINGKPAGSFHGDPPVGAGYIGMLAASADTKKGDTWTISDLKVTAPQ